MADTKDPEREAFEAFVRQRFPFSPLERPEGNNGGYSGVLAAWTWEAWQARALLSRTSGEVVGTPKCARCSAITIEYCNSVGCGFLESGNGAPAAPASSEARDALLTDEMLEVGRLAIEDALVELRDSRIAVLGRGNGLVIRESDGSESSIIRFGPETALRIGIKAMLAAMAASKEPQA